MKIQYKSQPLDIKSEKRYLLYRISPSELSWWKRTFKNPWRYAFTSYEYVSRADDDLNDCLCFLFSPREANEFVSKYDTYEKIIDFLLAELNKAKNMWHEAQEKYRSQNNSWKI